MKKYLEVFVVLTVLALFATGCIHLPTLYSAPPGASKVSSSALHNAASVASAPSAKLALQHVFNWSAAISVIAGLASLGLGAYSIYRGQILPGIKFILGGILLPVAGIFVAYHWILIVAICLIGAAVYLLLAYWPKIEPELAKIDAPVAAIANRVVGAVEPAAKTATSTPPTTPATPVK